MKTFSETLKRLMKERRISAKELSGATGVPTSTLSEWQTGRNPKLSGDILRVARYFGVSIEYLLTGTEPEELKPKSSDAVTDIDSLLGDKWVSGIFEVRFRRVKK